MPKEITLLSQLFIFIVSSKLIMYNIIESLDYYDECDGYLVYLVTEFADGYSTPHQLYTDTNKIELIMYNIIRPKSTIM